jgi:hypothetical protein
MRVIEIKKDGADIKRGMILMAIDGQESEVRKVEQVLDLYFKNTMCEEDGDNDGEISISYYIDRSEKKDFLRTYKESK